MATCGGHKNWALDPNSLEIVSRRLSESSVKLLRASENIPKGTDYSRRIALNSFVKNKVAQIDERVCAITRKLLALTGGNLPAGNKFDMADVLEGVNLCLRRTDRANTLAQEEKGADGSSRKRKRKELGDAKPVSIENLLTSGSREQSLKIRRTPMNEQVTMYKNSSKMDQAISPCSSLYLIRKDNFQWVYRSLLRQKVHELVAYNVDAENKLMFPTNEVRTKFIQLVSELPRTDCRHTSIDCLENYDRTIKKLEEAGFLTDEFGTPAVSIPNPYQTEIEILSPLYKGLKPPSDEEDPWGYNCYQKMHRQLFTISDPIPFKSIEDSSDVVMITNKDQLREFIDEQLNDGLEVLSIDVESHSQYSYRGYSCLLQLSTPSQDYIVDPSEILSTDMTMLNELFCCPSILKILHGGQYDVHWLQTDFGIYFVNLFDTFFASKVLEVPGGNSLANIVNHYCNVKLNKAFQLSDWRERPLSPEKIHYARSDSHYLYYIFQCMRNEILSDNNREMTCDPSLKATRRGKQLMSAVLEQAKQLCLQKISYLPKPFSLMAQRIIVRACMSTPESTPQMLRYLLLWRDLEARKRDVSANALVSDVKLFTIALKCPRNLSDLSDILSQEKGTLLDVSSDVSTLLSVVTNAILRIPEESFKRMITQVNAHNLFPSRLSKSLEPKGPHPSSLSNRSSQKFQPSLTSAISDDKKPKVVLKRKAEDQLQPLLSTDSPSINGKTCGTSPSHLLNHLIIRGAYGVRKKVGDKLTMVLKRFKKSIKIS